jgi:hypothetical protein
MRSAAQLANLRPAWEPGQSGNPEGKQAGTRRKLEDRFLKDLVAHWDENGAKAIERACEKDPVGYVRVVASLLPQKVDPQGIPELTRDELRAAISALGRFIAASDVAGDGGQVSLGIETGGLPSVPQTEAVP